jgi:hypothetical protein
MTTVTRRTMLTGVATTAVGAVGSTQFAAPAAAEDPKELASFVALSAALTGIAQARLAPTVDPIQIKHQYFARAKKDPSFDRLLQVFIANKAQPAVADIILNHSGPELRFLGRSIILAWYLGYWYEPTELERHASPTPPAGEPHFEVISPAAYTQGWTWRVAQAHPMGYSEWRFGYWAQHPPALDDFTT